MNIYYWIVLVCFIAAAIISFCAYVGRDKRENEDLFDTIKSFRDNACKLRDSRVDEDGNFTYMGVNMIYQGFVYTEYGLTTTEINARYVDANGVIRNTVVDLYSLDPLEVVE